MDGRSRYVSLIGNVMLADIEPRSRCLRCYPVTPQGITLHLEKETLRSHTVVSLHQIWHDYEHVCVHT